MWPLIKKIDTIVLVIIFTITVGIVVITMRSKTYSIGYEIASLKAHEKSLHQKQIELEYQLAETERKVRDLLLNQTNKSGQARFNLPDQEHVIRNNNAL